MARCGCASNVCTCTITGGLGVQVSGTGTPTDPYILGAQATSLTVADSASVDLTLTGNGSPEAPYLIRADLATTPNPGGNVPSGCILDFGGDTAPNGWLVCDGSAIARVQYSALFAILQTKYGAGDGSTTFNLPDLRSRFTIGAGSGAGLTPRTLAAKGGQQDSVVAAHTHALGNDSPDHAHASSISDGAGQHGHNYDIGDRANSNGTGGLTMQQYSLNARVTAGAGAHNHAINNPGANARHSHSVTGSGVTPTDQNLPPFVVLNKIIKT
jgi:microcystin-dependent protein